MEKSLLELIDEAMKDIQPMAATAWEPAVSIGRQLEWIKLFALGLETGPRPGPFSMGLIAVREFDMYGDRPDLSARISEIQRRVEAKLAKP